MRSLESRLEEIVRTSTEEAAINEWSAIQAKHDVAVYNYRLDHVQQVVAVAKHIAREVEADMQIVTLAAWLHDIAKPGMGGVKNHGRLGAEKATKILRDLAIEEDVIEKVSVAIEKHVGLTLEEPVQPLEAQVLWDADKIIKLGAIALVQYLTDRVRIHPGELMTQISIELNEFIPLGEKIAKSMNTEVGRKMALERLETYRQFVDALEKEVKLE
jgi:uncharacterized protein